MKKDGSKKLKVQKRVSALITAIGLMLLTYMIVVEDEPGAIPLLLIIAGTGWYFITRYRNKVQQNQSE